MPSSEGPASTRRPCEASSVVTSAGAVLASNSTRHALPATSRVASGVATVRYAPCGSSGERATSTHSSAIDSTAIAAACRVRARRSVCRRRGVGGASGAAGAGDEVGAADAGSRGGSDCPAFAAGEWSAGAFASARSRDPVAAIAPSSRAQPASGACWTLPVTRRMPANSSRSTLRRPWQSAQRAACDSSSRASIGGRLPLTSQGMRSKASWHSGGSGGEGSGR